MVNPAVKNVGRWSALAFGLVYGYTHNASLKKQAEEKQKQAEYRHKEELIEKARLAYAKKQAGPQEPSAPTPATAVDFENPDFDFDAYIKQLEAEGKI
ncbi:ATP synthase E chain-domain-containing protein [Radiomyces spectabilis]|uniref:ATP synthase E chain-domain-containing protein n=1 Tax=Radiomyces spectabilis TaxID=64574 RepID=UPI00221ECC77|nr:ATP synthase E chain-domain-containing protein [Radiomyces spectabilis]KAI8368261.1 ATP synthase E chain-domain-containing protein [Radiomyces spectabilis]